MKKCNRNPTKICVRPARPSPSPLRPTHTQAYGHTGKRTHGHTDTDAWQMSDAFVLFRPMRLCRRWRRRRCCVTRQKKVEKSEKKIKEIRECTVFLYYIRLYRNNAQTPVAVAIAVAVPPTQIHTHTCQICVQGMQQRLHIDIYIKYIGKKGKTNKNAISNGKKFDDFRFYFFLANIQPTPILFYPSGMQLCSGTKAAINKDFAFVWMCLGFPNYPSISELSIVAECYICKEWVRAYLSYIDRIFLLPSITLNQLALIQST